MAPVKKFLAALAGIALAFVLVMVLTALAPEGDLHTGDGTVVFDHFTFQEPSAAFTEGSQVRIQNDGAVPATFLITDPNGGNSTVVVAAGASTNLTLALQGTYAVTSIEWFWADQEWVVRSGNPFVRFVEDLF